ncbi:MAG: hypothetical protein JNM86_13285 [Phycisphaerae bacterium]|nr:hypothetical protein [Phycisphaerae bacterium]
MHPVLSLIGVLSLAAGLVAGPMNVASGAVVTGGSATWTVSEGFANSLGWLDANFSESKTRSEVLMSSQVSDALYTRLSGASGTLGTPTSPGFGYTPGQVVVGDSIRPFGVVPLNDAGGTSAGVPGSSRTRQATTLEFDPNNILATWTRASDNFGFTMADGEQIGFTNMQRWGGPFTGVLVYGDFGLRYNTANELVLTSNIDFLNAEYATVGDPVISLLDSNTLQISGRLRTGEGLFILDSSAGIGTDFGSIVIRVTFATAMCPGDLNADGLVDDADFVIFAAAYNLLDCADVSMPAGCPADLNSDGVVDDADFVIFAAAYNELVCP